MNLATSGNNIPNFLSAASMEGLRRAMLLNNIKKGYFFKYFDIQFVNNKWIAWYFDDADVDSIMTDKKVKR